MVLTIASFPALGDGMWISSFIVTLSPAIGSEHPVATALKSLFVFIMGQQQAAWLAVVLEAPDGCALLSTISPEFSHSRFP